MVGEQPLALRLLCRLLGIGAFVKNVGAIKQRLEANSRPTDRKLYTGRLLGPGELQRLCKNSASHGDVGGRVGKPGEFKGEIAVVSAFFRDESGVAMRRWACSGYKNAAR